MRTWRLVEDAPQSGAFNMAADQVLLERFCPGDPPILRLYAWERPTLSIGRNEPLDSELDLQRCAQLGIPVVRRITGGKAVLHVEHPDPWSTQSSVTEPLCALAPDFDTVLKPEILDSDRYRCPD